jgi:excisionase family DNA binding protein
VSKSIAPEYLSPLPDNRAVDIPEAAHFLKVSTWTVRRLILDGRLPATKIGQVWRINPTAVRALLAGNR